MPSDHDATGKERENTNIPSQFLNVFGFIDYKHDGTVPWINSENNIVLAEEYMAVTDILGIDCEMVGVGAFKISALGRVSIVNEYGYCIYDTFVDPSEKITDYGTKYSGIRAEDLVGAPQLHSVVEEVASKVRGRILVGHSIHNDLEVLKLNHPIAALRDTANFFQNRDQNKRTPALKKLIKEFFDISIQEGEHSSIQDAQATLKLYLLFREEWEKDALERRRKANLVDTVTDITCINVHPRQTDLFTESESVFIRPNKLVGAYYSSDEYKDIQFRLLMEDVLRPLRHDIRVHKRRKRLNNHYRNIRIVAGKSLEEGTDIVVRSNKMLLVPIPGNNLEDIDWDDREILLTGSLLILSPDNFRSIKCAKVTGIGKDQHDDSVTLKLKVNFLLDGPSWNVSDRDHFEMIESKAFFLPYEYTLNFLQNVDLDTFPMKKYIVDAVTKSDIAVNLLKHPTNEIDFSILMDNTKSQTMRVRARPLDYQQWPSASQLSLDQSQYEGLQKALTQELTIIQGPPGTGKSHVSLQIVKMLLTNKWLSSSPILIVSFTNHALDELLEQVLQFQAERMHEGDMKQAEQSLLRIGGGCESDVILPCTMKFKMEKLREKSINKKLVKTLQKAVLKVSGLDFTSNLLNRGIINFKLLPQLMLAKLETDPKTRDLFKLWMKSHKDIENDVFSWFGLNKQSINVRPKSATVISDGLFLLLSDDLEAASIEIHPRIPTSLENLRGRALYDSNQHRQSLTRWGYYLFLVDRLEDIVKTTEMELHSANIASKELQVYAKENATLKQAKVVGMTTTGAVKFKKMVETQLKPSIVLVEEAAHVLEAYVVASLTKHCQQLILIGDHKQLRPMITDYDLTKNFLDISLMERLVQNGIAQNNRNWTQLKVQHRMRPEIAKLICPAIYDELENHIDVEAYPNVRGCSKNLFFVHHENPESLEARSKSRFNEYEAKYTIGLLSYFTDCGYQSTQITVICTYLAQKTLIENTIKYDPKLNEIQISTVDGYQGKQNDLIILSLVRNNTNNNVGFLQTDNRVCVALSRARHGLIIIGNMKILASNSGTWSKINLILTESGSIGTKLPLNHPSKFRIHDNLTHSTVRSSSSAVRPARKHRRKPRKRSSRSIQFESGVVAASCGSQVNSTRPISPVVNNVQTTLSLPCGHTVNNAAPGSNLSRVKCNAKIVEKYPCGHEHRARCFERGQTTKCGYVVQKRFNCEHVRPVACHMFLSAKCTAKVSKTFSCGHVETVLCQHQQCTAKITKDYPCGHRVEVLCRESDSKIKCPEVIEQKYQCGHVHRFACLDGMERDKRCSSNVRRKLPCGHTQPTACHQNPLSIKCRHLVTVKSLRLECHQIMELMDNIDDLQECVAKMKLNK